MFCGFLSLILLRSMTALAGFRSPNMERHTPFFTGSRGANGFQPPDSLLTARERSAVRARSSGAGTPCGKHDGEVVRVDLVILV